MVLQLKANAVSVPCTLGSGAYRYIGIILSSIMYTTISPINLFIVPATPGPLNVVSNATQYQITHTTLLHETVNHIFHMYKLVQRALIQKVLEALEAKILARIRSRVTGQVPVDIQTLILHLFQAPVKSHPSS